MARIPDTDWPTIRARRQKGETLMAIAETYGATGAGLHGFIKRHSKNSGGNVKAPAKNGSAKPRRAKTKQRPADNWTSAAIAELARRSAATNRDITEIEAATAVSELPSPRPAVKGELTRENIQDILLMLASLIVTYTEILHGRRNEEISDQQASDLLYLAARTKVVSAGKYTAAASGEVSP